MAGAPTHSRASGALCLALVVCALAASVAYAFLEIFVLFRVYDDEGYVMLSVKNALAGKVPYRDFLAEYGPAFYLIQGTIYRLAQVAVSHDANRWITIAAWVLCAATCGAMVHVATRSLTLTLAVGLATVVWLNPLVNEPGHPEGLLILLTAGCVGLSAGPRGLRLDLRLMLAALLASVGVMMKINVGGLLLLALTMTLVLHARSALLRNVVWAILACAAVLLPLALMMPHLGAGSSRFAILIALSTLGTAAAAGAWRSGDVQQNGLSLRVVFVVLGVAAATILAFCIHTWAQGLSLLETFDALVLAELRMGTIFYLPTKLSVGSVPCAGASTALAVGFAWLAISARRRPGSRLERSARVAVPALKLLVVAGGVWSFASGQALSFIPPLLWVVVIPPGAKPWSVEQSFFRICLALVAVLAPLQAYPVAGTQVAVGTFLVVSAIGLCLHDGGAGILERLRWRPPPRARWMRRWLEPLGMAIVLLCFIASRDPLFLLARYRANSPLGLPGAAWIRLPAEQAQAYQQIVTHLRENCDSFVTLPGLASFHFWTRLPPPDDWVSSDWQLVLPPETQRRVIADLEGFQRPCTVFYSFGAQFWQRKWSAPSSPLTDYIKSFPGAASKFRFPGAPGTFEVYEVRVRPPRPGGDG